MGTIEGIRTPARIAGTIAAFIAAGILAAGCGSKSSSSSPSVDESTTTDAAVAASDGTDLSSDLASLNSAGASGVGAPAELSAQALTPEWAVPSGWAILQNINVPRLQGAADILDAYHAPFFAFRLVAWSALVNAGNACNGGGSATVNLTSGSWPTDPTSLIDRQVTVTGTANFNGCIISATVGPKTLTAALSGSLDFTASGSAGWTPVGIGNYTGEVTVSVSLTSPANGGFSVIFTDALGNTRGIDYAGDVEGTEVLDFKWNRGTVPHFVPVSLHRGLWTNSGLTVSNPGDKASVSLGAGATRTVAIVFGQSYAADNVAHVALTLPNGTSHTAYLNPVSRSVVYTTSEKTVSFDDDVTIDGLNRTRVGTLDWTIPTGGTDAQGNIQEVALNGKVGLTTTAGVQITLTYADVLIAKTCPEPVGGTLTIAKGDATATIAFSSTCSCEQTIVWSSGASMKVNLCAAAKARP